MTKGSVSVEEPKQYPYYSCALNEYVGENLPKVFTHMNIDALQIKWEYRKMRIIEFKYPNERLLKSDQQYKALKFLAFIFQCIINILMPVVRQIRGWKFGVYIVRGQPPFDRLTVKDLIEGRDFTLEGKDAVDKWLILEEEKPKVDKSP